MAKAIKVKAGKKAKADSVFPLERENYLIIALGLLFIVIGYIAFSGNSVDGFSQLTLAPLLLLAGYCVIIPVGILYKPKKKSSPTDSTVPQE
jgi:hypothetical protein